MKILKYAGNPYLFMSLYLLIIIEGQHFGGFYLLYLLLALPHGGSYAIISVLGILFLIGGYNLPSLLVRRLTIPLGVILMVSGLCIFFSRGTEAETFNLKLPVFTLIICGISGVCLLVNYINGYVLMGAPKQRVVR